MVENRLGGPMVGLGWLGLVEFDVDRPRSRATDDGHSANASRKTKNPVQDANVFGAGFCGKIPESPPEIPAKKSEITPESPESSSSPL